MASTDGNIRVHLTLQDKGFAPALLKDVLLLERLQKTQLKNNQLMRQSKDLLDTALTNAFGRLTARVADFGAKLVRLNLKGFALELGTVTAGLLLMKASLATGRFIAQAWEGIQRELEKLKSEHPRYPKKSISSRTPERAGLSL